MLLNAYYFYFDVATKKYMRVFRSEEKLTPFHFEHLENNTNGGLPKDGFLVWSPSCQIPDIDPWHSSIIKFIRKPQSVVCSRLPPLTAVSYDPHTDSHTLHVVKKAILKYIKPHSTLQCCYIDITRKDKDVNPKTIKDGHADNVFTMSVCHPFNMSVELSRSQEFLKVKCLSRNDELKEDIYANVHAIVAMTPRVQAALGKAKENPQANKLSVLLLGIDSISRMNLYRTMPRVVTYLKKQNWQELRGYNKQGDNTFPNLMAVLTGFSERQIHCYNKTNKYLDWCPIMWKDFASAGYITCYMEDEPSISSFNYARQGFIKTPTHYYLRPFMLAAYKRMVIKPKKGLTSCVGPTPVSELVWKYVIDFVTILHNSLYFGLFWLNNFSHDDVNTPAVGETSVLKFLKELANSGALNSSLIVFFSDHGVRFGPIRETYVGWLEERLPFIYIWVPEWYRRLHPDKYASLQVNRNRLTSPFDLRLTLLEILDDTKHSGTKGCPRCQSLFYEMPWNRSCEDAGVSPHWCTCFLQHESSEGTSLIHSMAIFVVKSINNELKEGKELIDSAMSCAELQLNKIQSVRIKMKSPKNAFRSFIIVFNTVPGRAIFEASVRHLGTNFKLIGSVSRLNAYGNQSFCAHDSNLLKYCFCV